MTIVFQFNTDRAMFLSWNAISQHRGVQQKIAVKGYTSLGLFFKLCFKWPFVCPIPHAVNALTRLF